MKHYVSFDIGGTKVKHGILSESGVIMSKNSYPTNTQSNESFINSMIETVKDYQKTAAIHGVALSFPGFINTKTGYIEMAGAIEALQQTNLKKVLEKELLLSVAIENDANCVALAEKFLGNAQDCQDFICLTIGTGIGGGIFVNGQLVRGHKWRAGEFGMMNVGSICDRYQNMHEVCSTRALIEAYKTYNKIPQDQVIEGHLVFEETEHGPHVQELVDRWLKYLSDGIFNLVCTLNPEKVLIGGGVSQREELLALIEAKLKLIPVWKDFRTPLDRCYFKNDAGLIGALYHFLNQE